MFCAVTCRDIYAVSSLNEMMMIISLLYEQYVEQVQQQKNAA